MKITKVRPVKTPQRGTKLSAGIDLFIPDDFIRTRLEPGISIVIPSGIIFNVPEDKAFVLFNKSGVAVKYNLIVGACVIDEDYQGETHINLINVGSVPIMLEPGEKIVQGLLLDVSYEGIEVVATIEELFPNVSERGTGWKGSTGTK